MAVATKKRRSFVYKGRQFYWWFKENVFYFHLCIVSSDKKFLVHYIVRPWQGQGRYIKILGADFAGIKTGGTYERLACPQFGDGVIKPKDVEAILDWCFDPKKEIVRVDDRGIPLEKK